MKANGHGNGAIDLATEFLGIRSPNPVLAGFRAADRQGLQRQSCLRGRLGRRRLEDARRGSPDRQRQRPALRRHPFERPARHRVQQRRVDHRPAARNEPEGNSAGQARLARSGARRLRDAADEARGLGDVRAHDRGHRGRCARAQLRLPARHVGARHGICGRAGSGIYPADDGVVQVRRERPGHRQADAERHEHPAAGEGGEGRAARMRCR